MCNSRLHLPVPPLWGDASLTSFPMLFSRLQPAAYIKCLQAAETLPRSLSKVKLSFRPPVFFVSPCHLTSPLFQLFPCRAHWLMTLLALGITQHIVSVHTLLWNISGAVTRSTFCWETPGCGFCGCAYLKGLFRQRSSQWLRIISSEIWNNVSLHTVSFLSSPWFRAGFCARSMSLWATTNGTDWAISNRKQHDV